jgi:hypothetical protein
MDNAPSSIPGTVYEYAAVGGIPIILVGGHGATKDFVERHGLGYACAMDNPDAIASTIQKLFDGWEHGSPRRPQGILDPNEFDRQQMSMKFCKILEEICLGSHYHGDGGVVELPKTLS